MACVVMYVSCFVLALPYNGLLSLCVVVCCCLPSHVLCCVWFVCFVCVVT